MFSLQSFCKPGATKRMLRCRSLSSLQQFRFFSYLIQGQLCDHIVMIPLQTNTHLIPFSSCLCNFIWFFFSISSVADCVYNPILSTVWGFSVFCFMEWKQKQCCANSCRRRPSQTVPRQISCSLTPPHCKSLKKLSRLLGSCVFCDRKSVSSTYKR